ncbi:MAG: class I SAM-dependent methyltransferase [Spirochaetaceae bacterium]|nr:MAG: class I SAM-dependent methyltransferase [Spirochaetaceae bacterium]
MSLRFHEIAERDHRILNPFTEEQLMLLGEICALRPGTRQLDLCCGKGEMLCRWAAAFGVTGIGVDISTVFLAAANRRAEELAVDDRVEFVEADASAYPISAGAFDVVSCIGATWIGNGLPGTLEIMRPGLRNDTSLILVGEPYWIETPPDEAFTMLVDGDREVFTSLPGTLDRFDAAGFDLIEMVIADHHGWDRYEAAQWPALSDWLRDNPTDPDAAGIRDFLEKNRRAYLTYGRRFFGWGVFVLRAR